LSEAGNKKAMNSNRKLELLTLIVVSTLWVLGWVLAFSGITAQNAHKAKKFSVIDRVGPAKSNGRRLEKPADRRETLSGRCLL